MKNPFTPAFGIVPAQMAGRDLLISEMSQALDNIPGDPGQTTIFIGARGTGKTALLSKLATEAESDGWISVSVTATPGMLMDIIEQLKMKAAHLLDNPTGKRLSKIEVKGFGVSWDNPERTEGNWRTQMTEALDQLEQNNVGLLMTVDEVDPKLDEMLTLVSAYQHLVIEGRKIALFMAGLPDHVSPLLNGKSVSFLRRANQKILASIPDYEIENSFRKTILGAGKDIEDDAVKLAVKATNGFPYMMQLVGFRSWSDSEDSKAITLENVKNGARMAGNDMKLRVLKPTLDELSKVDLEFLNAMLLDKRVSKTADIAERLGKSTGYVSGYKRRLIDRGVIESSGRGPFKFALPMLREYLPEYIEDNRY